jgi:hypothetical protein
MSQFSKDQYPWIVPQDLPLGLKVVSTTRFGGVSLAPYEAFNVGLHVGDDAQAVLENRRFLRANIPAEPRWLEQVHGCDVVDVDKVDHQSAPFRADAAVTSSRDVVLTIQTADCLPVVIYGGGQVLGVAHAGWRGLAAGVLSELVLSMTQKVIAPDGDLKQWQAWIGPCIGPSAFQVGEEVRQAFLAQSPNHDVFFQPDGAPHKWRCDLPGLALHTLQNLGITQSKWCGFCTVSDEQQRFFSYRRDGRTGRMATLAWLG